ncbi:MAG: hypothetical protein ACT4NL_10390 [Pseudomarimonas sp.]
MHTIDMNTLDAAELNAVSGGTDQATAIGTNLGIIGIGVGILAAGATAPVWFPLAMIGISVAVTASYISTQ